jgi:hypothetical protein
MFIREAIKKAKGKNYVRHHLVESVRTPAGPRQRIILDLGQIGLPKKQWKELANAIESILYNKPQLFEFENEIKSLSKHYANLIIRSRMNEHSEEDKKTDNRPDYVKIDVNSISVSDARTVGIEHIVIEQLKDYEFDNILKSAGLNDTQTKIAKILTAGKLTHPASERETARWANENSSIKEFLGYEHTIYDNALHRTALELWEKREEIEQKLSEAARDKFSLKETIVLYDLTNTYFEGTKKTSKIANPGVSKEKRNDRPLVTLALCVDDEGFPKNSRVFEGNVSEPKTLKSYLEQLSEHRDGFDIRKTIVIDAGIATEDNLEMIKNENFEYVAVSRKRTYEENFWDSAIEKNIVLSDKKSELNVKMIRTTDESFLLCHSPRKEAKETAIFEKRHRSFESEMEKLKAGLKNKGARKGYEYLNQRIGRLKEKYGVGHLYEIVIGHEKGIVTNIECERNGKFEEKSGRVGEYVIRTSHKQWSEEQISKTHKMLSTLEDSFRSIKSDLGLRPNYHKNDINCQSHIFICVLAYHIMIAILKRLEDNGIRYRWESIRNILSTHVRVSTVFNTEADDSVHIRTTAQPNKSQSEIYNALAVRHRPLKTIKLKILSRLNICSDEKTG